MEINWKRKLSSRKFWAAVVAFLSQVGAAIGVSGQSWWGTVILCVTAAGTLCIYMLAEARVDAASTIVEIGEPVEIYVGEGEIE